VIQTTTAAESIPQLEEFKSGNRIVIAGSSWPTEEKWLQQWWVKHQPAGVKLIIAPHDISAAHIQQIQSLFPEAVLFSEINNSSTANVLIIDSIGLLARAYRYGDIAIVGGAFGKGLHNILEAAAFGLPVIFGPNTINFGRQVHCARQVELLRYTHTMNWNIHSTCLAGLIHSTGRHQRHANILYFHNQGQPIV
jgi:3-deoxy-D-manno-octulosonic-acid transferase